MPKVSYISLLIAYARGGSGGWGGFGGVFGGSGGFYPLIGRFVDSWRAFGAFCVRVRARFSVRAGAGVCPPHFSRAPNPWVFTLS